MSKKEGYERARQLRFSESRGEVERKQHEKTVRKKEIHKKVIRVI